MKQMIIVALLCLNAALLVALVTGTDQPAYGQAVGGRGTFAVSTGKINTNLDAVYILDTASRRVAILRYDRASNRLQPVSKTELARDFGRQERGR